MQRSSAILLALLVACTATSGSPDRPAPAESTPQLAESGGGHTLFYLKRTTLTSVDVESGRRSKLAALPSADVAMAPDTTQFVVVEETSPLGPDPEGFREPQLRLRLTEDGGSTDLGAGRAPLWAPDGTAVAAIAPVEGEACPGVETEGEGCAGTEEVVAYNLKEPDVTGKTIADPALGYSLLGWSGETVLSLRAPGVAVLGNEELPFPPAEVWGASPAGEIFLHVDDDGARFTRVDAQAPVAEIDLNGASLGDGTWSFDGRTVAVVLLESAGARLKSRLALIDAATGSLSEVPGGRGAQGQLVWTSDSDRFAFTRIDPDNPVKLQAVSCSIALNCRSLFSFREGITLLGLR
jgi:hypothetical protein